jgi:hypothetical protein
MVEFSKLLIRGSFEFSPLSAEPAFSFIMTVPKPQGKLDGFTALSSQTDDKMYGS